MNKCRRCGIPLRQGKICEDCQKANVKLQNDLYDTEVKTLRKQSEFRQAGSEDDFLNKLRGIMEEED